MKSFCSPLLVTVLLGLAPGCTAPKVLKAYSGVEHPAAEVATILLPSSVEVRSVNGQKQPNITATLLKKEYAITTLPGTQKWELRYNVPLAGGYYENRQTLTESPWLQFQFSVEAGKVYRLNVETPEEDPLLRRTAEHVRFSITADGKTVSNIPQHVKAQSPAAAVLSPPAPINASAPKVDAPQTLESAALGQLKKWWGVAGPEEQRAFRDWLKQQP